MNQSMLYSDMLTYFLDNGVVESNSPKNRKKLYDYLRTNHIKYTTEIIGYTNGRKSLCRWGTGIGWDIGRVVRWIEQKRLLPEDLEEHCRYPFEFDDIKPVFGHMSNSDRADLIIEKWGDAFEWTKWTPFDKCSIRKTIVRITHFI